MREEAREVEVAVGSTLAMEPDLALNELCISVIRTTDGAKRRRR